jgi:uncharacterized protein (TIGR00156 family)
MKKILLITSFTALFSMAAFAQDAPGLKTDKAPPPPHKMEDGYRGMEDARSMTIKQAKTMHDGASVSLKGNLVKKTGRISTSSATKPGKLTSISQWPFSMAKMSPRTNWWALAGR